MATNNEVGGAHAGLRNRNGDAEDHQEVPCELQYAGCDFKGDRYQMTQHRESNMPRHLSLISEFTKKERDKCNRAIAVIVVVGVIVGVLILGGFLYFDRRLANLEGRVKLLNHSKVASLERRIKLLKNSLDKNASSLQRLRQDFKNVKLILCDLGIDVEKLMTGFSKKYIDDTFRAFFKSPKTIPIA